MSERNIRLTVAYDGTDYSGWQRQKEDRSVQEELEKALARMHGHPVPVAGSGRTDAGVHARGQAAGFLTDIAAIPAHKFVQALNASLPRDIRILEAREVAKGHHVRFDARLRRYRYFILPGTAEPWRLRYATQVFYQPDIRKLQAMAAVILGEKDFTTFCAARDPSQSRFRHVFESSFRWESDCLVYEVAANAFLLRMVRSLTGSMLEFERKCETPESAALMMKTALEARDRKRAGATAAPQGLFLWNIEFYETPGSRDITALADSD